MNSFCDQTEFLEKQRVTQLMDNNQGVEIWFLLNVALWWKEFIA